MFFTQPLWVLGAFEAVCKTYLCWRHFKTPIYPHTRDVTSMIQVCGGLARYDTSVWLTSQVLVVYRLVPAPPQLVKLVQLVECHLPTTRNIALIAVGKNTPDGKECPSIMEVWCDGLQCRTDWYGTPETGGTHRLGAPPATTPLATTPKGRYTPFRYTPSNHTLSNHPKRTVHAVWVHP